MFDLFHKDVLIKKSNKEGVVVGFHQYKGDKEMSFAIDLKDDKKASGWYKQEDFELT